jgi:hypothetical protein
MVLMEKEAEKVKWLKDQLLERIDSEIKDCRHRIAELEHFAHKVGNIQTADETINLCFDNRGFDWPMVEVWELIIEKNEENRVPST